MISPHIEVEGLRELQAAIRAQVGKLPDALGKAHKNVGAFIIGKLPAGNPNAVGAGTGATVRASATKREVLLMVGTNARTALAEKAGVGVAVEQWGRTEVQPFESGRPYILGTIEENEEAIGQFFLDEVTKALAPAFYSAE